MDAILSILFSLESLAVALGLAYVLLAAGGNRLCWIFGFFSVTIYFFLFIEVKLYSDAMLQIFFGVTSLYGWINWQKAPDHSSVFQPHRWDFSFHLKIILLGGLFTFLMGNFWMQFGAALPFTDAFTTVFSIIATILVARKNLENWLYWIVIDIVATGVYINREMYPTALLFFLYTLIAVFGWINWKNMIVQK